MATASVKTLCITCGKEKVTYDCKGCQQSFCFNHLAEHKKELGQQLDGIENERNDFTQTLGEQKTDPSKHLLVQQIDQWEEKSIQIIKQAATEARDVLMKYLNGHCQEIERKLQELTEEMKEYRREEDFNELSLNDLKDKLNDLEKQLNQPENIRIEEEDLTLMKNINVIIAPSRKFL